MTVEAIEFDVRMAGVEAAVRDLGSLTSGLRAEGEAATTAARSTSSAESGFADLARGSREVVQRIQGMASAVQGLVSSMGSRDRTAGLVASIAGTTSQFAAMGAMLGPGGALVGGLAGLTAGLVGVTSAAREATEELSAGTVTALRSVAHALADGDESGLSGAMVAAQAQMAELRSRAEELRDTAGSTMRGILDPVGVMAARAELAQVEDQILSLEGSIGRLSEAAGEVTLTPSTGGRGIYSYLDDPRLTGSGSREAPAARRSGGGRARPAAGPDPYAEITGESANDAADRINEELAAHEEARTAELERVASFWDEQDELRAEHYEAEREALKEQADAELEIEREKQDAIRELADAEMEHQKEKRRQALQDQIETQEEFMQLGMNVVGMLTDALGDIVAGEKTAEQAFKGMAKAFLQMISQYAALKAATEFADAIASFARYDFGGGAAHLGAGIAFTAVAVATGVGAAAINTSRPTVPSRPEPDKGGDKGRGGGDTIINWNSPVVTASTRDDLGRELGAMMRAGEARYGG